MSIEISFIELKGFVLSIVGMAFTLFGIVMILDWKKTFNKLEINLPMIVCFLVAGVFFLLTYNLFFKWVVLK